jgi:hypothetical protein
VQSVPQTLIMCADFDNVVSLCVYLGNNKCINMYLYVAGNKNAEQIRKIKI